MEFRQWLNENQAVFTMWSSDGRIVAIINGVKYEFLTDPVHVGNLKRIARFKPMKAVTELNGLVQKGAAQIVKKEDPNEVPF